MTYYPYIGNKLSEDEVGNSTKVLLSKNSVFTGNWEPVDDYGTICVAVAADNPTSGTLTIQTSSDGGQTIFDSKSFAVSNTMSTAPFFWNQVEGHVRVLYSNGSLDQSGFFHLQTRYSNTYPGSELDSRVRELYEGDEYVSQEDAIGTGVEAYLADVSGGGTEKSYLPNIDMEDIYGFTWGLRLRKGTLDKLIFRINDNLTGLTTFNAIATGTRI